MDAWYINHATLGVTYRECQANLKSFGDRGVDLEYLRMLTSKAVDRIGNGTMDFIYVDARHDYCGVKEDMELYWPKLRDGGIIAVRNMISAAIICKYALCSAVNRENSLHM